MFGAVCGADDTAPERLADVAREFTPRVEICEAAPHRPCVTLDLSGLTRLFGDARTIADELRRTAADKGVPVRVAIAGTRTAARLLAHARAGITIVEPGTEAAAVAPLPLSVLSAMAAPDLVTLRRWGLRTCGDFAALPAGEVAARLGQDGVAWQRLAQGADALPLLPAVPEERFEQSLDLEWPIEGLEPLAFVLGRLLEPLSVHLERRDRGAAVLHVRLHLVTKEVHERSLQMSVPMRDARTLRTLTLLDLESHPPAAAIDRVVVAVDPTPGRVVQFSLLTRPMPSPEQLSTLMARLSALMGEGRCGAPAVVDSWQPGACAVKPFVPASPESAVAGDPPPGPAVALRRFRFPVPARVAIDGGRPARVATDRPGVAGGHVTAAAGPWRTSGGWWKDATRPAAGGGRSETWDRDEWDVTLRDGATYRVFRERTADAWFVDGIVD